MKPLCAKISPRPTVGAGRVDLFTSTGGSAAAAGIGGQRWDAAIVRRPRLSLELFSPNLDGKTQLGRGDLVINLNRIRQVSGVKAYYWLGAPITIYDASNLDLTSAPIEFTGYVRTTSFDLDSDLLTLNCEVSATALDRPVLFNEFSGGGGINGDAQLRGTPMPAGFGSVQNVEPVWFDNTNNIGMIDGYGNCTAITSLFEGGNDFGAKVADYATYALLLAAITSHAIPPGRWGSCVAQGLVGLGAPPVKPITVDATFGSNRVGAIIQRLLTVHAGVAGGSVDSTSFNAVDTAVNYPVHHWLASSRSVKDLIEALSASVNATPLVTFQGKYSITRAFGGTVAATINKQAPTRATRVTKWRMLDPDIPTWRMRARTGRPGVTLTIDQLNYADDLIDRGVYASGTVYRLGNLVWGADGAQFLYINATPTSGNALPVLPATSTAYWSRTKPPSTAADLVYADGTPIENLKPAEAAANVTATHTAAAITGQAATATSSDFAAVTGATKPEANATQNPTIYSPTTPSAIEGTLWANTSFNPPIFMIYKSGAWRTAASVGAAAGSNLMRADGTTVMTQAEVRTIEGVAASITGQAATATSSDFASVTGATKPAAGATAALSFVKLGSGTLSFQGNDITRTDASAGWTTNFLSQQYTIGSAYVGALLATADTFIGLTDTITISGPNATQSYYELDYSFLRSGDGNWYIFESGSNVLNMGTGFSSATLFLIVYTGLFVLYFADGVLKRTVQTTGGRTFRASGSFNAQNYQIKQVRFGHAYLSPDLNSNIIDSAGGYATVPRNEIRTPLGTAAAIAGQGAWATAGVPLVAVLKNVPNLLFNGSLRLAQGDGWAVGWIANPNWARTVGVHEGPYVYSTAAGTQVIYSDPIPIYPSNNYAFSAEMYANATGKVFVDIEYYSDAACTTTLNTSSSLRLTASGADWARQQLPSPVLSHASANGARFRVYTESNPASVLVAVRRMKLWEASVVGVDAPFSDERTNSAEMLTRVGTGRRLGDGRNIPPISAAGIRYRFNASGTYTAAAGTPATATISMAATTLTLGSQTISYNAMSVNVTGTNNTTTVFNLYIDDPYYVGGTQTLVATTSTTTPYQNDARIFLGQVSVFFPASGGGSGGGGGGGGGGGLECVWADAFVHTLSGWKRARYVIPGDLLWVLNDTRDGGAWQVCEANSLAEEPCFHVYGAQSGIGVTVSHTTPIELDDGRVVAVADAGGEILSFEDERRAFWKEEVLVEPVGVREVCKITAGQRCYSAGDVPGRGIFTHNWKP